MLALFSFRRALFRSNGHCFAFETLEAPLFFSSSGTAEVTVMLMKGSSQMYMMITQSLPDMDVVRALPKGR